MAIITIHCDDELKKEIAFLANVQGRSVSKEIILAINNHLEAAGNDK